MLNENNCLTCAEYNAKPHRNLQQRSQTNNSNKEVKTFDLNDADVTEENGCWVFRFPERPETISIGVMRIEDFAECTQYDDQTPVCEPINLERRDRKIMVTLKNEIIFFHHFDEAILRLMRFNGCIVEVVIGEVIFFMSYPRVVEFFKK